MKQRGFTLLEMLVATVIMAMLHPGGTIRRFGIEFANRKGVQVLNP